MDKNKVGCGADSHHFNYDAITVLNEVSPLLLNRFFHFKVMFAKPKLTDFFYWMLDIISFISLAIAIFMKNLVSTTNE